MKEFFLILIKTQPKFRRKLQVY